MASLRQLPSGNWQAAVLLDNGRRTTQTKPTMAEAIEWATETERKRDEERSLRAKRARDEDIAITIAALERYAQEGLLNDAHRSALQRILESTPRSLRSA